VVIIYGHIGINSILITIHCLKIINIAALPLSDLVHSKTFEQIHSKQRHSNNNTRS